MKLNIETNYDLGESVLFFHCGEWIPATICNFTCHIIPTTVYGVSGCSNGSRTETTYTVSYKQDGGTNIWKYRIGGKRLKHTQETIDKMVKKYIADIEAQFRHADFSI